MQEKEIEGYEGLYRVDSLGRVFSCRYSKYLNPTIVSGYAIVELTNAVGVRRMHRVHRLVATHFIPPVPGKDSVDHIDRNPSNNCVSNLRWADVYDQSANRADVIDTNKDQVLVHTDGTTIAYYDGFHLDHGLKCGDIRRVLRGERKSCGGWSLKK